MFKSITVVALFAFVAVQGGIITHPVIAPSGLLYQSFTDLVGNVPLANVVGVPAAKSVESYPVVKAAEPSAETPEEKPIPNEATGKSAEAAQVDADSVEVVAAPGGGAAVGPATPAPSLPGAPLFQNFGAYPIFSYPFSGTTPVVAYHPTPSVVKIYNSTPLIYG